MDFGEQKSLGGIVILSDDGKSEGVRSRWGKVWAVGAAQKDVKVGEWILLEHGRWSRGITIEHDDGTQTIVRRADIKAILAVADDKPAEIIHGIHGSVTHATVDPSTFVNKSFEN
jgi:co-chaperonin GroES (HSP10)